MRADELAEWLAVARHRAGEPVTAPDPDEATAAVESLPSEMLSADSDAAELADADAEQRADADAAAEAEAAELANLEAQADPQPPRKRQADGYDPLAGWSPGRSRRPL
ncbi:hypothetical protein [Mycobacterium kubicae]|uniref:hypothetical protein n=1 Tax=Mycobacterium kubicae TaxID=120959 RepID=UPI001F11E6D6|nr:hypothetical protein [Mycobacterium kubicae]